MSYQVIARKWRPQTFQEVVGQEAVTLTLQNAIRSDRIAHAFLFSGVRGVGKTTTARILAKALNCRRGLSENPCGECASCLEIAASGSVDVLEIDAASNTGVDNIRELRESARYNPARDRFKIFIIDEVHMLSNQAFNALLKTLEEPPPHVKFILATTELRKIPETIVSRCQQFDFKPIPFAVILDRLKLIGRQEGIEISDYGLRAIVSAAGGSMRDAQSILDQVISFAGTEVADDDVRTLLGVVDESVVAAVVEDLLEQNRESLLGRLAELAEAGIDPQNFSRKVLSYLRDLMVCKAAGWDPRLIHVPDSQRETLIDQAGRLSEADLIRFYDLLVRMENELRWNPQPQVHLEMALMKLAELARLPALEEVISRLQGAPSSSSGSGGGDRSGTLFEPVPPVASSAKTAPRPTPATRPAASGPKGSDAVVSRLLALLQVESMRIYMALQNASAATFEKGTLRICFPAAEAAHANILGNTESLERLKLLCAEITGETPHIEVQVEEISGASSGDPTQDPRVKAFVARFPGKMIVERKLED